MSFSLAVLLLSPLRAGLTLSFAHAVFASTFPDGRHRRAPPLPYPVGPAKAAHQFGRTPCPAWRRCRARPGEHRAARLTRLSWPPRYWPPRYWPSLSWPPRYWPPRYWPPLSWPPLSWPPLSWPPRYWPPRYWPPRYWPPRYWPSRYWPPPSRQPRRCQRRRWPPQCCPPPARRSGRRLVRPLAVLTRQPSRPLQPALPIQSRQPLPPWPRRSPPRRWRPPRRGARRPSPRGRPLKAPPP